MGEVSVLLARVLGELGGRGPKGPKFTSGQDWIIETNPQVFGLTGKVPGGLVCKLAGIFI
jgi:hypothetical protein